VANRETHEKLDTQSLPNPVFKHHRSNYGTLLFNIYSPEVIPRICRIHKIRNVTSDNPKNYEEHKIDLQSNRIRNQSFVDLNAELENI
jgi:hypothetical protein